MELNRVSFQHVSHIDNVMANSSRITNEQLLIEVDQLKKRASVLENLDFHNPPLCANQKAMS